MGTQPPKQNKHLFDSLAKFSLKNSVVVTTNYYFFLVKSKSKKKKTYMHGILHKHAVMFFLYTLHSLIGTPAYIKAHNMTMKKQNNTQK